MNGLGELGLKFTYGHTDPPWESSMSSLVSIRDLSQPFARALDTAPHYQTFFGCWQSAAGLHRRMYR